MEDSLLSDDKTPRMLLRLLMANLGPEETPEALHPHRLRRQAASSAKRKRGGAGGSSSKRSKGGEDASLLKVALQPQSRQSQQFSTSRNESLNASTIKGTDLTYMNITAFNSSESSINESIDLTAATRFRKRKQRPQEYDAQSEVSKLVIKPPIGTRSRKKHPQAKKSSRAAGDSASRAKTEVTLPSETTYAAIDTSLIDSSSDSIDYGKARNLRHRTKKEAIEFQQKLVKPSMASKTSTKGSDSELVEKTYADLSINWLELSSDSSIDLGAARNMRKRTRLQVMAIPDVDPAAFAHKPSKDTSQMQTRGSDKSLQMSPSKSPRKSSSLQKDSDMSPSKSPRKSSSLQEDSDMSPSKSPRKSSSLQEDSDMSPSKSPRKSSSLQKDSDMSPSKSPRKSSSLQEDSDMSPSKSPRKSSSLHKDSDMSPSKSPRKSSSLQEDSDMSPSKSPRKSSSLHKDSDMSPSKSPQKSSSLQEDSDMSPSKSPRKSSSLQEDSDMSPSKSPRKSSSLHKDSDMSPSKSPRKSSSLQEDSDMSPSKSPRKSSSLHKDSDMSPSKSPQKSSSLQEDNLPNVASYVEANNSASESNSAYDFDKTEESFENIKDIAKQRFARKVSPMNFNLSKLIGGLKPCSVMVTDISLSLSGTKEVSDPGTKEVSDPGTKEVSDPGIQKGTDPGTQEESVPETPEDSDTEAWEDSVPGIQKGTDPGTQEESVPETQEDSDTEPWEESVPGTQKGTELKTRVESDTGTQVESNTGTQTLTVKGQGWTEDKGVLKDQGPSLTEEIIRRTESPSGSLPVSFVLQGKSIIEEEPPLPPGNTHDGLGKYTAALATDFPLLPPISFRDIEIDDHESQLYVSTSHSSDGADVDLESSISAALSALDTDSEKKSKESPEIKLQLASLDTTGGSHSTRSSQSAAPNTDSQELVDPGESTGSGGSLSSNDEASSSPARKRVGMQASLLPLRKSPRKSSGKEPLRALFKKSPRKSIGMKALLSPSKKTSVREASFSPSKKSSRKSVGLEVSLSPSRKSPRKSSGKETSLSPLKKSPRRSLGVKALPSPSRRSSTTSVLSSWSRDKMSSSSRTTENTSNLRSIVLTREQVEVHPEEAIKAMQRASRTLELEGMSVAASEPTLDQQAEILTENVRDGNQVKSAESAPKEKAIMQKDSDTGHHQLNLAPSDDRTLPAETEAAVSLDDFEESVEDLKLSEREEAMQGDSESDHYTLNLLAVPERKHYHSPSVGTSLAETEAAVYHVDIEEQTENGEPSGEEAGHVTQPQKKSVRRLSAVGEPSTSAALARTKQLTMREFIDKLAQKPVQPPPGVVAEAKARPQLRDLLKTRPPAARAPRTVVKKTKKIKQKPLPVSLPKGLTKEIFTHYALCKLSTRGMDEVMKTCEKYWKNLFSDLDHIKTARKGSAEIKTKDMRKLLSRQGLITTDVSLYALVEEYLPVEEWNVIMPTQFAKGRIYPPEEIIDEMFNSG
ncbi:nascent polypeptide-associated complex subunit alpha, muscle-specific form-like [Homarus americanus]|uniref:PRQFV-amide-like n=1 Tax=Homarus americanus TaxID=6706 RepID=A0A8J5MNG8_HOMAM|nr:nascent polypeptide-associated complex subunit alpha, muscle-specific form-like [Homarus americanus]KAG7157730.1 PRQFV-amide-like [Homarus americanus]